MNLLTYLLIIALFSAFTFFGFHLDKIRTSNNQWKIPTRSLILMIFLFGSVGGLLATYILGYKEKKIVISNFIALAMHMLLGVVIYILFGF